MNMKVDRLAAVSGSKTRSDVKGFLTVLVQAGFVDKVAKDRATWIISRGSVGLIALALGKKYFPLSAERSLRAGP